jgi:hypothetical protein
MKTIKSIPSWATIIGLLLLANIGWLTWNYHAHDLRSVSKQFKVAVLRTNGVEGIELIETKTGQPIWIGWDFDRDGTPSTTSYFFQGKNVMNIYAPTGKSTRREVIFYGEDGKAKVSWADRSGTGLFTERIFYDRGEPLLEVWYNQDWYVAEQRNNKRGIVVDGRWLPLQITNGIWTTTDQNAN